MEWEGEERTYGMGRGGENGWNGNEEKEGDV
jgi:hypothetical protein